MVIPEWYSVRMMKAVGSHVRKNFLLSRRRQEQVIEQRKERMMERKTEEGQMKGENDEGGRGKSQQERTKEIEKDMKKEIKCMRQGKQLWMDEQTKERKKHGTK